MADVKSSSGVALNEIQQVVLFVKGSYHRGS